MVHFIFLWLFLNLLSTSDGQFSMPFGKYLGCFKTNIKGASFEVTFKTKIVEQCAKTCKEAHYRY